MSRSSALAARAFLALSTSLSLLHCAAAAEFTELREAGTAGFTINLESTAKPDPSSFAVVSTVSFEGVPSGSTPVRIYGKYFESRAESRGNIVLVNGRTEATTVYTETISDFLRNGYSVYTYDHRGQGFSTRLLSSPDESSRGYVDDFDNYVRDLSTFIDEVAARRKDSPLPMYLVAHSMGGAVSALYIERNARHPFKGMVLVTPMFEPWATGEKQSGINNAAQVFCDSWATRLQFAIPFISKRYIDGKDFNVMYDAYINGPRNAPSDLTSSESRLAYNWEARRATCSGAECGSPDARIGGSTVRWFNQACSASREARGPEAAKITIPTVVLQGKLDTIVNPSAQTQFCDNANAGRIAPVCKGYVLPKAKHAIFIEADESRVPAMVKILAFLNCLGRSGQSCT